MTHVRFQSFREPYLDSRARFQDAVISILSVIAKQERFESAVERQSIVRSDTARDPGGQWDTLGLSSVATTLVELRPGAFVEPGGPTAWR